jgi:hypothetical protein
MIRKALRLKGVLESDAVWRLFLSRGFPWIFFGSFAGLRTVCLPDRRLFGIG